MEFLRHQLAKPAKDRLWLCDLGDFSQTLSPESLPDLDQSGTFRIREPQPRWRVRPQDSVLSGEILDLQQQQFLIQQPRHVCQQTGHLTPCFLPACIFSGL
jgi:hypothetical protein